MLAELPRHTQEVLLCQGEGCSGITPFAWWAARAGLWPLPGLALMVCLACMRSGRGRRP